MPLTDNPQWAAVYTAPRAEKAVTARISDELRLEAYLPVRKVVRRWSDRFKEVEQPLIPSYTFVRLSAKDVVRVRQVRGVVGFVMFGASGIAVIPPCEMDAVRRLAESAEELRVCNTRLLHVDAHVRVKFGHFEGLEGCIVRDCKDGNFSVRISQLDISLVMDMPSSVLEVLPK